MNWRFAAAVLAVALLGTVLLDAALRLPFGEPAATRMDDHYIAFAQRETAADNVVTSIVFDYRGFDTLGEASVLFTAVLGVGLALRRTRKDEEIDPSGEVPEDE
jgi:multisubunit Na+/H+ antiporter MnhB subunit